MREYFGVDARGVRWAHAVNSRAELAAALADPAVHMLEADLLMSRPPARTAEDAGAAGASSSSGASPGAASASEVLMCHPPARESDLGFEDFMSDVVAALREGRRVGIKLDFKEIECVAPCVDLLRATGFGTSDSSGEFRAVPLWLNADVVRGPGGREPIAGADFVSACVAACPNATLSLGWTHTGTPVLGYTTEMANAMRELVEPLRCGVTLAASAAHLFASANPARAALIDGIVNDSTGVHDRSFTLWGPAPRPVLRWIENALPAEKTFVDVKGCAWREEAVIRAYAYTRPVWAALHDAYVYARARRTTR